MLSSASFASSCLSYSTNAKPLCFPVSKSRGVETSLTKPKGTKAERNTFSSTDSSRPPADARNASEKRRASRFATPSRKKRRTLLRSQRIRKHAIPFEDPIPPFRRRVPVERKTKRRTPLPIPFRPSADRKRRRRRRREGETAIPRCETTGSPT